MSYPLESYDPNNNFPVDQQFNRSNLDDYIKDGDSDLLSSFFDLVNRLKTETVRSSSDIDDLSTFISSDKYNTNGKVFSTISSTIVTQICRELDDRLHIIEAYDECRTRTDAITRIKKVLRDLDHDIGKL